MMAFTTPFNNQNYTKQDPLSISKQTTVTPVNPLHSFERSFLGSNEWQTLQYAVLDGTFYVKNRISRFKELTSYFEHFRSSEMSIKIHLTCSLLLGLYIESFRK
jgi:hypothetical protein